MMNDLQIKINLSKIELLISSLYSFQFFTPSFQLQRLGILTLSLPLLFLLHPTFYSLEDPISSPLKP